VVKSEFVERHERRHAGIAQKNGLSLAFW
jgi:hypothetical protein